VAWARGVTPSLSRSIALSVSQHTWPELTARTAAPVYPTTRPLHLVDDVDVESAIYRTAGVFYWLPALLLILIHGRSIWVLLF
jgi:hypothetical protein